MAEANEAENCSPSAEQGAAHESSAQGSCPPGERFSMPVRLEVLCDPFKHDELAVVHFRVVNSTELPLPRVRLFIDRKDNDERWKSDPLKLGTGETKAEAWQFHPPGKPGTILLKIKLLAETEDSHSFLGRGQAWLVARRFERQKGPIINPVISKTGGARKSYGVDDSITLHINVHGSEGAVISEGGHPGGTGGGWQTVPLDLDVESSRRLSQHKRVFVLICPAPPPVTGAILHVVEEARERHLRFFSRPKVTFGRDETMDVYTRVWRRTGNGLEVHEAYSRRLSRAPHAAILFDGIKFILEDSSQHGTLLSGRKDPMLRNAQAPLVDGCEFSLAGLLAFRFATFCEGDVALAMPLREKGGHGQKVEKEVAHWGFRSQGVVDSARLRRDDALDEEIVILVRQAFVGSNDKCCIQLSAPGVVARHARILFGDGAYWFEDLEGSGIKLNDAQPGRNRIHQLPEGAEIQIGGARLVFDGERSHRWA